MKVRHTFICFFFLSLQDGNTGVVGAEIPVITGQEGGNITYGCPYKVPGNWMIFCKAECEDKDVLLGTTGYRAQRGRYSIEYKSAGKLSRILSVSITNLRKSDSGRYRCRQGRYLSPDSDQHFDLRVAEAPVSSSPPPTSATSASTPTLTQTSSFTSGGSTASSASTETTNRSEQQQRDEGPGTALYVSLPLSVMIVILSAAALIISSKPKESFTVYTCVTYTTPNAAEPSDVYRLIAAATSRSKSADDPSNLTYSTVNFTEVTDAAPNSTAENVFYSVI